MQSLGDRRLYAVGRNISTTVQSNDEIHTKRNKTLSAGIRFDFSWTPRTMRVELNESQISASIKYPIFIRSAFKSSVN